MAAVTTYACASKKITRLPQTTLEMYGKIFLAAHQPFTLNASAVSVMYLYQL